MRPLLAALRFLTILPLPASPREEEGGALARSLAWFPVVGLLLGALLACLALMLRPAPPLVAGALLAVAMGALHGALHLDGLADSADALLSHRSRERMLEILRDSRIGTMGAFALATVLLLKAAALASIAAHPEGGAALWRAVLVAALAGRCLMLMQMTRLPYARPEGGLADAFYHSRRAWHGLYAAVFLIAGGGGLFGGLGLLTAGGALLAGLAFERMLRRRLGGATGDTLGAASELGETVTLLLIACGG